MARVFAFILALCAISSVSYVVAQGPCKSKNCAGGGPLIPVSGGSFFGKECKSKGCGIVNFPSGPIFYGGGCKSKGCPLPPSIDTPPPPPVPVCCTPDKCIDGYRSSCKAGALTPSLARQGYFSASGSCTGPLQEFPCDSAKSLCTGNRGRCVFKSCPSSTRPTPTPSPRPRHPRPSPRPKSKSYPPHHAPHTSRMNNTSDGFLWSSARQSFCKSKGCPFGKEPDTIVYGGSCKSKGCGIFNGPTGSIYFGGACKSKGCPFPASLLTKPRPPPRPSPRPVKPAPVPAFRPPRRGECCFSRPCNTQRICRCIAA